MDGATGRMAGDRGRPSVITRRSFLLGGLAGLLVGPEPGTGWADEPLAPEPLPGTPAPPAVIREIQATLTQAIGRFQAKDLRGVLAHVSDQYWTGPFTKATIRSQLAAIFQVHSLVRAPIRIDAVRLVGSHAWVYTTGSLAGLAPVVNQWYTLFNWDQELEVARREQGAWRLYGYQQ